MSSGTVRITTGTNEDEDFSFDLSSIKLAINDVETKNRVKTSVVEKNMKRTGRLSMPESALERNSKRSTRILRITPGKWDEVKKTCKYLISKSEEDLFSVFLCTL